MRRLLLVLAFVFLAEPLFAQTKIFGWCQDGNYAVTITGQAGTSPNKYQRSFPSCTVTVYNAGTLTLATIFADGIGTAKANPFTAAVSGQWFFYGNTGHYDVKFSGGGIPAPFTIGDFTIGGGASSMPWIQADPLTYLTTPTDTVLVGATAADDVTHDTIEAFRSFNNPVRINLRNDSTGTAAETAFTARAGPTGTSNAAAFGITSASFTPVGGISAAQGYMITGASAANGILLLASTGPVTVVPSSGNPLLVKAGNSSGNHALTVLNASASATLFDVRGDGATTVPSLIMPNNATPPATTAGQLIIYQDNTGVAKVCQNGAACVNLVGSGGGGGGWTNVGTGVLLTTPTNRVVVGSSTTGDFAASPAFDGALVGTNFLYASNGTTTNSSVLGMGWDVVTNTMQIVSGQTGTGTFLPLQIKTNGQAQMQLGTDGRLFVRTLTTDYVGGALLSFGRITEIDNPINAIAVTMAAQNTFAYIASEFTGTNSYKPLAFQTSGMAQAAFDTNGILLVGNNFANVFAADDTTHDIGEFWKTLNAALAVNIRNDSAGTTAQASFVARDGPAATANSITTGVTSGGFSSVGGLVAQEGYIATGTSAVGGMVLKTAAGTIKFQPNGNTTLGAWNSTGLTITGASGTFAETINGTGGAGANFGLEINAGTNSMDYPLFIQNASTASQLFNVRGDGNIYMGGTTGSAPFVFAGGATGAQVTITTSHTNAALSVGGSVSSGNSFGIDTQAGTTSGDFAFRASTNASVVVLEARGDGAIVTDLTTTGAATGKKVVCVDTSTGILYASSAGNSCAN